ncbi:MAG: asparagine synthetase B, partial [bacterium]|nr:asparagine synthetase B [bacterium]
MPVRREELVRMRDTIAYRGPDATDLYLEPTFGLGHCRLAVIDLGGGHQPMRSSDGNFVIAFNGEIYNFRELATLYLRDVHLQTASDTEVLLELFARYGEACLPWLNGMFAFAIWDRAAQTLTLARDRFGKKPLYYADFGDTFLFGSEPKALLAHPRLTREPDPEALVQYLLYEYIPGPRSAFRQIRRVPPASRIRVTAEEMSLTTWWHLPTVVRGRVQHPAADILTEADALLSTAVRR